MRRLWLTGILPFFSPGQTLAAAKRRTLVDNLDTLRKAVPRWVSSTRSSLYSRETEPLPVPFAERENIPVPVEASIPLSSYCMDASNISPSVGGAIPARLGLPRRSSFDPLSTSSGSKKGLSLGALPGPSFAALPSGLRSVPALDSARPFGSAAAAFRNVSGPLGDGQRTPGGSLVVGAEVFGFGKHAPRDSSERRRAAAAAAGGDSVASGSVDGLDEVVSTTGSAGLGGTAVPAGWRASNDLTRHHAASSSDDLRLRTSAADDARFRKGLDRLSAVSRVDRARSLPFPRETPFSGPRSRPPDMPLTVFKLSYSCLPTRVLCVPLSSSINCFRSLRTSTRPLGS